ncbi:hypothetical protein CAC42_1814 [Sphaceloma murrayae]|uniref:Uncharacterized protein n=1 Tax=Sphaceloma murrayae TaxID=2082308 RepID=A0A2K1QVJ1_9PEZI|nr:hypothetical protein CAC42_1814 [Sphaceloma murrayae]
MSSGAGSPGATGASSSPNEQVRSGTVPPMSSPLSPARESSDESEVYITLPPPRDTFTRVSAMRSSIAAEPSHGSFLSPFANDPVREKKHAQLLSQGFDVVQIIRFLGRPCFDTATDLIRSKGAISTRRLGVSARNVVYKNLELYGVGSSTNWILLDPLNPDHLLSCLVTEPTNLPIGSELWTDRQETPFLRMLQYGFYTPPTAVEEASSGTLSPVSPAAETAASTTASATPPTSDPSPITESQTITKPRARKSPPMTLGNRKSSILLSSLPSTEPTASENPSSNPADRYLEYNTRSHAVRLRAGFQSRFATNTVRRVLYTPLGPRWADEPIAPTPNNNIVPASGAVAGADETPGPESRVAKTLEGKAARTRNNARVPTGRGEVLGKLPSVKGRVVGRTAAASARELRGDLEKIRATTRRGGRRVGREDSEEVVEDEDEDEGEGEGEGEGGERGGRSGRKAGRGSDVGSDSSELTEIASDHLVTPPDM